jgi:hypothetical protein
MCNVLRACALRLEEAEQVVYAGYQWVRKAKEGLIAASRSEHVIEARMFVPDRCICADDTAQVGYLLEDQPMDMPVNNETPLAVIMHDAFDRYLLDELHAHLPAMVHALRAGHTCVSLVFPLVDLVYSYVDWPCDGPRRLHASMHRCFRDPETVAKLRKVAEATGYNALVNMGSIVIFAFT